MAWIESFREKIEDAFPDIVVGKVTNDPKPSIDSGASLLHGERKEIDVARAKESVEWVSGVLWQVHRLAQDEFLVRTRAQAEEWLENVSTFYAMMVHHMEIFRSPFVLLQCRPRKDAKRRRTSHNVAL